MNSKWAITEQQSPEECSVKEPILDHPRMADGTRGRSNSAQTKGAKLKTLQFRKYQVRMWICSGQRRREQPGRDQHKTAPAHRTSNSRQQTTHFDFSPYWAKEAGFVTDLLNTEKISAEEPSAEDECLSKKTPAQITAKVNTIKVSPQHHGKEQESKRKGITGKQINKLTPWSQSPKVHHSIHRSPPPVPIVSQLDPLYTPAKPPNIDSNPILPYTITYWSMECKYVCIRHATDDQN
jgi:hypothetical protein